MLFFFGARGWGGRRVSQPGPGIQRLLRQAGGPQSVPLSAFRPPLQSDPPLPQPPRCLRSQLPDCPGPAARAVALPASPGLPQAAGGASLWTGRRRWAWGGSHSFSAGTARAQAAGSQARLVETGLQGTRAPSFPSGGAWDPAGTREEGQELSGQSFSLTFFFDL